MKQIIKGLVIPLLLIVIPVWVAFGLPYWLDLDLKNNWYGFPYLLTSFFAYVLFFISGIAIFEATRRENETK